MLVRLCVTGGAVFLYRWSGMGWDWSTCRATTSIRDVVLWLCGTTRNYTLGVAVVRRCIYSEGEDWGVMTWGLAGHVLMVDTAIQGLPILQFFLGFSLCFCIVNRLKFRANSVLRRRDLKLHHSGYLVTLHWLRGGWRK